MFHLTLKGAASVVSASFVVGLPTSASAAAVPSAADLKKLQQGHARVQVLLVGLLDVFV